MSPLVFSLLLVVVAQFINAATILIDKYIVTHTAVSNPSAYSFYVGMASGIALLLIPFGVVHLPDTYTIWVSAIIGITFVASILLFYTALKTASATDVVPLLGAVSTVSTFLLSFLFLNEELPSTFPIALILFVIGTLLVGHFRFNFVAFVYIAIAGLLFGFSAILMKILFMHVNFVDGFFWSRIGNFIAALGLLLWPECREAVLHSSRNVTHRDSFIVVADRIMSGAAVFLILYAIRIGTVSLVNALSSLQFVFVFLIAFLLISRKPALFAHEFRPGHILHKVLATLFIISGFFVLFL